MCDKKPTARQLAFLSEYLIDLNATQAAIRAGYSAKAASQTGSRILHQPNIAEKIAEAQKAREMRTQITQDRVLKRLADIAFGDGHKDSDALRALEFCGRHLGMFKDRQEPITSVETGSAPLSMAERAQRLSFLLSAAKARSD